MFLIVLKFVGHILIVINHLESLSLNEKINFFKVRYNSFKPFDKSGND
jgi:hypothetical protein